MVMHSSQVWSSWIWFSARIDQPKQATQIRCKCWLGWLGMVPCGSCFVFGLWHGPGRNDQDTSSSKSFRRNQRVGWLRVSMIQLCISSFMTSASKTNPSDISLSALFEGSPSVACCFWNCHVQIQLRNLSHEQHVKQASEASIFRGTGRLGYGYTFTWAVLKTLVGWWSLGIILSNVYYHHPIMEWTFGFEQPVEQRCGRSLPWNSYECGRFSGRWWNTLCCSWGHPAICGSVYLGAILCHGHEGRHKKKYMFFCSWNHVLSTNHSASTFLTSKVKRSLKVPWGDIVQWRNPFCAQLGHPGPTRTRYDTCDYVSNILSKI